jgi:hypothetical protein
MGSSYANVLLREPDVDAVAAVLEHLGRRAYVAGNGAVTVVYDERSDQQPRGELERLATLLSSKLGRAALAVANYHDDVLEYQLADNGRIVDRYDSYPGFLEKKGRETPEGGDARRLCLAFGVPEQEQAVAALLLRTRFDIGPEIERHEQLLRLLGLPPDLAMLGYAYVREGDLDQNARGVKLIAICGAPAPMSPVAPASPAPDSAAAALATEAGEQRFYTAALVLNEIDVPPKYATLLGRGRVNGYVALHRLNRYLLAHGREDPATGHMHVDDLVADLLGERAFPLFRAGGLLVRALGVPLLSAQERAEFQHRGSATHQRYHEAFGRALEQATKIGPLVGG